MADEFDSIVSSILQQDTSSQAAQIRNNVQFSVGTNPDQEANFQHLAKFVGVPIDTVRAQPEAIKTDAALQQVDADRLAVEFPQTAKFLTSLDNTRLVHDDIHGMTAVEKAVKFLGENVLKAPEQPPATVLSVLEGLAKSLPQSAEAIRQGFRMQFANALSLDEMGIDSTRKAAAAATDTYLSTPQFESRTAAGLYSGVSSLLRQIPGMAASILTRSTVPMLAAAGVQTEAEAYSKYRLRGATPGEAILGASGEGVVEVATEMIPMGFLVESLGKVGAGEFIKGFVGRELVSEQLATVLQDAIDTAVANPDKTWGEYAAERPDAAYQTFLATLVQSGALTALHTGMLQVAKKAGQADTATQANNALQALSQVATAGKLRERDPQAFKQFVEQVAPEAEVYIDARTLVGALQQSGVPLEDVHRLMPEVGNQINQALDVEGDVRIPVSDYATHIAGGPADAAILPSLKAEAGGMTYADAQVFYQTQAEEMQHRAAEIAAEKANDNLFQESAASVERELMSQLQTANRFTPDVNEAYAKLASSFYTVQAARLGITPEELYVAHPLEIKAESLMGSKLLDQSYNQSAKGKRDVYTQDLFGLPTDSGADTAAAGSAARRQGGFLSRDDAPGTYATRTELVKENTRQLGTHKVNTPDEAAQALAYLGKSAVEHFDAVVTDKNGKPLAIVGAFKGALTQASVYPATLVAEAFRVKGAANIWFAHNHPSGNDNFSAADLALHKGLTEAFQGSEIQPRGLFAIAAEEGGGRKWVFEHPPQKYTAGIQTRGITTAPGKTKGVPVVERVYAKEGAIGPVIASPAAGRDAAKVLASGEAGVILMSSQNVPVAFVPVKAGELDVLRTKGRMDALYRALSIANAGSAIIVNNGILTESEVRNLAGLFNSVDTRVLDVMDTSDPHGAIASWAETGRSFGDRTFSQGNRGAFNPETGTLALLKNADLSTFLHELGHFQIETLADIAGQADAPVEIKQDMDTLLKWFGVADLPTWTALDFEEKRSYHEQFARGFESYLFEGKSPSVELSGLFSRFRAWLLNVYRSIKSLNVEITDEVRSVMDRLLASSDAIKNAEQVRGYDLMFKSAEAAGMTPEQWAEYQGLGTAATENAIEDMTRRSLRNMQWLSNAKSRALKDLQKEAAGKRREVHGEVTKEVWSQPVYQAWQFLIAKENLEPVPATPKEKVSESVDPSRDTLLVAIAKLGGVNKAELVAEWGLDPAEKPDAGLFGKPVLRAEKGRTLERMAEALSDYGYLKLDEHGKYDLREFEDKFFNALSGAPEYSNQADYDFLRAEKPAEDLSLRNGGRLNTDAVRAVPGGNKLETLRMTRKDGLNPDLVAEMFGFSSGDELIRTLADAQRPRDVIEGMTDQRMLERYGELSDPQAVERAAEAAIHNEARAKFVATELRALTKATGPVSMISRAARESAENAVANKRVRELRPAQYTAAEGKAARASTKALAADDIINAAIEKRAQLLNNQLARAAEGAVEEVRKGVDYLKKFDKEGSRKALDAEYLDQVDALLDRFDLRKGQSLKAIDKRTTLAAWMTSQREMGLEPDIPEQLQNEALRKSYKDMTVAEFRGLIDTVKQIEHLGRLKHLLLTAKNQRAYEAVRDEIAASVEANSQGRKAEARTPTTNLGRTVQRLKNFWAAHRKAAMLARTLDGEQDGGPMWEYFVRSANERGDQEATMRADATRQLSEIMAPVFKLGKMGGAGVFFPTINRSLNREARITLALNTGNAGNLQRLLGGEGWTVEQIKPVLDTLTAAEWHVVQAVWDHFESYKPLIGAKERRVYGKEPAWVDPLPVAIHTADKQLVEMRGGYYPIKYDPAASQRAEEHVDAEGARRQLQGAYTSATTRRSFTKARAEEVTGRPLLYSLSGLYSGVSDVIHDLSWHEWLIDTNRLMRSTTIDNAIRQHYGPEVKAQFKTWIADVAEGERGAANAVEAALSRLRQGVSAAGLGFNVVSALMQPLGITQSITRVGAKWIGKGVAEYIAHPLDAARKTNAMSEFMMNRSRTRFRELNELRNKVEGKTGAMDAIQGNAYFLMMRFQQAVDVPTWLGAYEKATAEGNDEQRSRSLADQAVIDSQGGGMLKDLSAVERGGPALKLFTVFYSFMNTAFNLSVNTAMSPAKRASKAVDLIMLGVIPPFLALALKQAITAGGGDDDWDLDKLAKRALAAQIDYLFGSMIVAREFSDAAKTLTGANDLGRDYQGPAGTRMIADTMAFAKQAHQGEFDAAFRKATINVVGDLFGLPSAQVNRTIGGAEALSDNKTDNPAALVFGYRK